MRNLAQYPVTELEILQCLGQLESTFRSQARLGDMRPVILATAAEIVKAVGEAVRQDPAGQSERFGLLASTNAENGIRAVRWDRNSKTES